MARFIAEFGGKYLEWSTIVDAPVTRLMDEDELRQYIENEYGEQGLLDLPARMTRVAATGTSAISGTTKADLLAYNRAGENEGHLRTDDEIVARYAR